MILLAAFLPSSRIAQPLQSSNRDEPLLRRQWTLYPLRAKRNRRRSWQN
jgi:hypothetical protein